MSSPPRPPPAAAPRRRPGTRPGRPPADPAATRPSHPASTAAPKNWTNRNLAHRPTTFPGDMWLLSIREVCEVDGWGQCDERTKRLPEATGGASVTSARRGCPRRRAEQRDERTKRLPE